MSTLQQRLTYIDARIADFKSIKREKEKLFMKHPYDHSFELSIFSLSAQLESFISERDELQKKLELVKGNGGQA